MSSLPICCLLMLVVIVPIVTSITVPSQYVTRYYSRKVLQYTLVCRRCGWWWWRRTCCYAQCAYVSRQFSYRACKSGYTGTACNIPVCSPRCQNKGVCVAVNKCDCPNRYSGSLCQTEKCSWAKDCYPGICNKGTTTCTCSAEFDGPNCETMKEAPIFNKECSARIINRGPGHNDVHPINCSYYGDEYKLYTNMVNITHVGLTFSPTYRKLDDLPTFPTGGYLRTFRVGLIQADANVVLKDTVGGIALTQNVNCVSAGSWLNPQETINCNKDLPFARGITHKQEMEFTMSGTTGGFKDVRNQDTAGSYVNRQFVGRTGSIKAYVIFDLEAPFHCTEGRVGYPCEEEIYKPIIVDEDLTNTPEVNIAFAGWNDTDAGLRGYTYSVHPMVLTSQNKLQHEFTSIINKGYDLFSDDDSSNFTLPAPGLYAIIAQVHDFANNTRWARCMVLYSSPNDTIETTNEPITVSPGPGPTTVDNAYWMTDLTTPVKFKWGGHFANKFISDKKLGNAIEPLSEANFLDCRSNISTAGTPNVEGITAFSVSVVHRLQRPATRKRRQLPAPTSWTPVDISTGEVTLTDLASRESGTSFTVHMKVEDMMGNILTDYTYIRMDNTKPIVNQIDPNFTQNVTRPDEPKGFYSSVDLSVLDTDGGLDRIGYTLYDTLNPTDHVQIRTGWQVIPQTSDGQTACLTAKSCWCTNEDECYDNPVKLYLNNCWFVEYMDVPIEMELSVNNRAGLSQNITYDLGKVTGISGVGEYPPPLGLRVKNAYGYVVILTWYLPTSCYGVRLMNLELTGASQKSAVLSASEEEVEIKDLVPYADYTAKLTITYQGNKISVPLEFKFNTGKPPVDNRSSSCGIGCIIGIVIGVLILIGMIIVIVLVCLRMRKKKTPLPRNMMGPVNRMSRHFGHTGWSLDDEESPPPYPGTLQKGDNNVGFSGVITESKQGKGNMTLNVAYNTAGQKLGDFEQDIYTYGEMETEPSAKWKHSDDRITIGKIIHKGRFAEIKEAKLHDGSGTRKVAAKFLLKHSTENDLLMTAKMNFLATAVKNQNNIVNFVGAVTEGPIILLELCDKSLKDWLNKVEKVNDEVEDNMINFCTDVARGMSYLAENGIKHRRLGARNVLLKYVPELGRLVGKVTGFGPMKGEGTGSNVDHEKERIPVKWMAIEQLGIETGQTRPYTEETDVWSFGVTVWEIFSKGDNPYSNLKSSDIRAVLDDGTRLECPQYASDELYKEVMLPCWNRLPEKRPMFQEITDDLERLFHGAQDGEMYYDDAPRNGQQDLYDGTLPSTYR